MCAFAISASPKSLGAPDAIIIPGTKSTMADLQWMQQNGLADALVSYAKEGVVTGICGGYQMLGECLRDPYGAEAEAGAVMDGLGLLPMETVFAAEKRTERVRGTVIASGLRGTALEACPMEGYEIHMGRSLPTGTDMLAEPLLELQAADEADTACIGQDGLLHRMGASWAPICMACSIMTPSAGAG